VNETGVLDCLRKREQGGETTRNPAIGYNNVTQAAVVLPFVVMNCDAPVWA